MEMLRTAVSALSFADPAEAANDRETERRKAAQLIAQLPTIVARYHRPRQGLDADRRRTRRSPTPRTSSHAPRRAPTEQEARAFDVGDDPPRRARDERLDVHRARRRRRRSSDMHSAVVGAIGALKGPLHGGANEQAMALFERDRVRRARRPSGARACSSARRGSSASATALHDDGSARGDPQAAGRASSRRAAAEPNWFAITDAVESACIEQKGLWPNVDLYSGSVYRYLGIPTDLFTPLFAVQPRRRLGRARARAARGQQDHPAGAPSTSGRSRARTRSRCLNLAEAAAAADELADAGDERELANLRREWEDEVEARRASPDYRVRAVAYRAIGQFRYRQKLELLRRGLEDESPACRGSALLSLELLSRDSPGVINSTRPRCTSWSTATRTGPCAGSRSSRLKNGPPARETIAMLRGLADDDDRIVELRETRAEGRAAS